MEVEHKEQQRVCVVQNSLRKSLERRRRRAGASLEKEVNTKAGICEY